MSSKGPVVVISPQTADSVGRRIEFDKLVDPIAMKGYEVWLKQKGADRFRPGIVLPPRDLAPLLRHVILIAIVEDGRDYEFRIMGDAAVVAFGRNFKGFRKADLNNLQTGFGDVIARVIRHVMRTGEPLAVEGMLRRSEFDADRQQAVFLPLGTDDVVDHVLYVGGYTPVPFEPPAQRQF